MVILGVYPDMTRELQLDSQVRKMLTFTSFLVTNYELNAILVSQLTPAQFFKLKHLPRLIVIHLEGAL